MKSLFVSVFSKVLVIYLTVIFLSLPYVHSIDDMNGCYSPSDIATLEDIVTDCSFKKTNYIDLMIVHGYKCGLLEMKKDVDKLYGINEDLEKQNEELRSSKLLLEKEIENMKNEKRNMEDISKDCVNIDILGLKAEIAALIFDAVSFFYGLVMTLYNRHLKKVLKKQEEDFSKFSYVPKKRQAIASADIC
uniref:Uncharacterized protein n=1 Tax=Panagrolaimus sp. ES5 TaxID=591445 RepID=A0AC34FMM1_9BILA